MAKPHYRRRIILINKPFQLRFCVYITGCFLALCFIYPLIVGNLFDYFIRYLAADPTGPAVSALMETRQQVLMLIIVTEVAFLLLTFLIAMFMSHRIAGPLYKLRKTFEEVAKGTWNQELHFRQKDYFRELAIDFNQMIKGLKDRDRQESEMLAIAASRIETAMKAASPEARTELEPALVSLRKLQEQKSLG